MSRYKKIQHELDMIQEYTFDATDEYGEPIFYGVANHIEEIERLTTPLYIKIYDCFRSFRPIRDEEIPF